MRIKIKVTLKDGEATFMIHPAIYEAFKWHWEHKKDFKIANRVMKHEEILAIEPMEFEVGYEVEKDKLYTARLEIIYNERESYINKDTRTDEIFLDDLTGLNGKFQIHFTQAELEELNVWGNPAFEIEEVEE